MRKGKRLGRKSFENKRAAHDYEHEVEGILLTALSMNGRIPFSSLGELVNLASQPTYRRVKLLENKYGMRYTAEIDIGKLGYLKFLMLIKFASDFPKEEEMTSAISREPEVQFAAMLRGGAYDLILYALAKDNYDIQTLRRRLMEAGLGKYEAKWYIVPFDETYSFVPLRDEFIETLKNKALKGREKKITAAAGKQKQIIQREFTVLKELNARGKIEFKEIDKKYSLDAGRSQYAYFKLLSSGLLKRITITMRDPHIKYIGAIFMTVTNYSRFIKTREKLLRNIMGDSKSPLNKYLLVGDIGEPYGIIFLVPVFDDGDLEERVRKLSKIKGTEISIAVITKILYGNLCYRRFDNAYSIQHDTLIQEYGVELGKRIGYGMPEILKNEEDSKVDFKALK